MKTHTEIEALHRRLVEERRKVIEAAAKIDLLPANNLLAYLANLDGATLAVEAVLEQQSSDTHRS